MWVGGGSQQILLRWGVLFLTFFVVFFLRFFFLPIAACQVPVVKYWILYCTVSGGNVWHSLYDGDHNMTSTTGLITLISGVVEDLVLSQELLVQTTASVECLRILP